jgi:chromosome segregation ATPase
MTVHSPRIRRLVTVFGVIAALLIGYGSIRAAAAWAAASAPLTVAPVSVTTLQDRLAVEQARSVDLRLQLQTLNTQSTELTAALEAAQAQITTDTDNATQLAKDLKAAKKKLAKLEASIAKARLGAQRPTVVVTKTQTVTSASSRHEGEDEDEDGGDDD